jgi:hypothetical protein
MKTAIFLVLAIAALGAVGIVSAIMNSSISAHAVKECAFDNHFCYHGCPPGGQGDTSSGGACEHFRF